MGWQRAQQAAGKWMPCFQREDSLIVCMLVIVCLNARELFRTRSDLYYKCNLDVLNVLHFALCSFRAFIDNFLFL